MSPARRWWRRRTHPNRLTDPPHPVASWVYGSIAFAGTVIALAGSDAPASIKETLPDEAWRVAWAAMLAVGGVAALSGQYWRGKSFLGADVKRVGLMFLTGGCGAYAAALWFVQGPKAALLPLCQNAALAAAFLLRAAQITVILQKAHREAARLEATGGP